MERPNSKDYEVQMGNLKMMDNHKYEKAQDKYIDFLESQISGNSEKKTPSSTELINKVKERFKAIGSPNCDWGSFYEGFLDSWSCFYSYGEVKKELPTDEWISNTANSLSNTYLDEYDMVVVDSVKNSCEAMGYMVRDKLQPETVETKSSTLTKDEVKGWIGSKDVEAKEEKKEFYCANRNQKLNTDLCNVSQCEKCKSIQRLGSKN